MADHLQLCAGVAGVLFQTVPHIQMDHEPDPKILICQL